MYRLKTTVKFTSILAAMFALASCNSQGTGSNIENTLDVGTQQAATGLPAQDEIQDPRAFCPKTAIRSGTETYNVFPKGVKAGDEGALKTIRYRATIYEHVRECNSAGSNINIKVGVRGRYLSGPKGDTGSFIMPLRIAVVRGEEVLYSQLHQIQTELSPGRPNGTFSYVDQNISILKPERPDVVIYVGFDEGPYDTP